MKASSHWFFQRVSAAIVSALVPMVWWFVGYMKHNSYGELVNIIKTPCSLLVITVICFVALYHARLGMEVVIDDYTRGIKRRSIQLCADSFLLVMLLSLLFSVILLLKGN